MKPLEHYLSNGIEELKGFAMFLMEKDGTISTWNKGCKLMKGYEAEEVIGQNFRMLFPGFLQDEGLPEKEVKIAQETGRYETENWRRKKDGELFWAFVVLTRIDDDEGNFIGFMKITQDQSEKKKLQDQLQSKLEDFGKINADLYNFANLASHDLKAPVNNMEGLALMLKEELEEEGVEKKAVYDQIDLIYQSALKLKGIITDMAASVKEETNEYTYQSFEDIVKGIKILLSKDINNNKVSFLEDYSEAPLVRYPKKHIHSIMHNLITNAIKYRSPESLPEIRIKTTKVGGYTLLEISDNGIGIQEENKDKIFEMYHRVEENTKEEGTGVGLGLVAKIVEGNQGRIEVESKINEGSKFSIYLK